MKILSVVAAVALLVAGVATFAYRSTVGGSVQAAQAEDVAATFYDLETHTLEGEDAELADWEGKVALVVNVASKCGLTPQYEGLEALHKEFSERGFTVLGFPSNDFMGQEPGTPEEIRTFCSETYGVTFPMFEKSVVTGDTKSPVYQFLTRELEEPTWNFTKYLVDRSGRVLYRFPPQTKPEDAELRAKIESALAS